MSLTDRYEGKPLVRLLELYVLWTIDDLSEADAAAMDRLTPELAEAFESTGSWQEIVARLMEFPPDMVERTQREFGRIDILVNNAGTNIRKPPHQLSLEEWESVIKTNLTSAFLCSQAVHPAMKAVGGGKIINIGSMMSIFGVSFSPAYAASKGGIVQFTRSCAVAWAADNIQANAVLPGWIDTDLTKRARAEIDGLHDKVLARTPAARWGATADFAGIAVFLSSSASDFVTGTAIPVDGGFSIMG